MILGLALLAYIVKVLFSGAVARGSFINQLIFNYLLIHLLFCVKIDDFNVALVIP